MSNEIARKSYQDLVDDPYTNFDLLDKIEERLIVDGVNRPLSNTTPPAEWDAYWQRIADAYELVVMGPVLPAPNSRWRSDVFRAPMGLVD